MTSKSADIGRRAKLRLLKHQLQDAERRLEEARDLPDEIATLKIQTAEFERKET